MHLYTLNVWRSHLRNHLSNARREAHLACFGRECGSATNCHTFFRFCHTQLLLARGDNAYEILATAVLEERSNDASREAKRRGCATSTCALARTTGRPLHQLTHSNLELQVKISCVCVRRRKWRGYVSNFDHIFKGIFSSQLVVSPCRHHDSA